MREQIIQEVLQHKVIAIVRGVYGEDCIKLAQALWEGGIRLLEVTFNQQDKSQWEKTLKSIRCLNETLGDRMRFGAGTVTSVELVRLAKEAGASFIVSPDTCEEVIRETVALGMVSMPGALTPTEVLTAHRSGADFVKLFPAGELGSGYLKAVRAPLNHVRLLAVGGVDEKNAAEFIQAGAVGVGAGGKLVNKQWIAEGNWEQITLHARKLQQAVQD